MPGITPFLWFDGNAEEAVALYTSLFADARITATTHYGPGAPLPEGAVLTIAFELAGQRFVALNAGSQYRFTPAISFAVACDTQAQIDALWERLSEGGSEMQCGWLTDRFGVTWQITPARWEEWLGGGGEPAARVMAAMMTMVKLDIAALERAFRGE
jgi:predicted 3-demethylubiquinone-9 3-methyltransferase (glyoxalase superfamily)